MHREQNTGVTRSPSISTHGSLDQQDSVSWNGSSPDSVPQGIDAVSPDDEVSGGEAHAAALVSTNDTAAELAIAPRTESPLRRLQGTSQEEIDSDLTPRIGTTSSILDTENAPLFPMGVFRRPKRTTGD